ncbi:3-hydroxyacyl-ACP dehydratase [Taibaiella chishuiensis]|uniref:3-hydroxymyristoyl/3-hydroxydecanoyl-(Acyl carrier protein) dehydratase n=1 Tax=Taibaiella chishuiensis TaxID=1434707 RepID=A0A2P8D4K7_9BACT|nr:3-hydroxyacyl-ACP dehydratase [Taibaiella chishuiensis]PSK92142.1 3-hydroxymyristoyl/3-hydroxydecanoyl-(acyl carrier protein) dehydratase [Taibaiella chishuiensis]
MKYIPQGPPFVMIDELLRTGDTETLTAFTVREGHLFVDNGHFTEPGLMENMAQTAAAGMGKKAEDNQEPVRVGFIGAIKNWQLHRLPVIGDTLNTRISVLHQVMNAHIVQAVITCGGAPVAEAEFKIFLQEA